MRALFLAVLFFSFPALGRSVCGAPTPGDAEGSYRLETILPPPYMGRPRHIHVKVARPGARVLTTQLYFPGESRGANRALVVKMERDGGALPAAYDFVI